MPSFAYTARSRSGQKVDGVVEATDRRTALAQIERLGHVPVSVSEAGKPAPAPPAAAGAKGARREVAAPTAPEAPRHGERMGTREVLLFTTELRDLLASGMRLGNALNTLANRKTGRAGDRIIPRLRDEIVQGASLSDALSRHPRSFPNLYVNMIKAGEASGAMSDVMDRLVVHYERVQEVKEKVLMALVYPAIVMVLGAATLVFSLIYVVPKFKMIFQQMGQALPLPTRMLLATSDWLARYGLFALVGIGLAAVLLNRLTHTPRGRRAWDGLLLRLPLIHGIVAAGTYANFARTLATLLGNGVPVLKALGIVEQTVGNAVIAAEIRKARDRVTDGTTISGPLAAGKVFPLIMTDMLAIGEQTGDMSSALKHIARRYENELDRNVKIFTTALEPLLIVLVAVMVGFVAISILMAVFNLTNGLDV
jgi:type II secretory pathway component PulF